MGTQIRRFATLEGGWHLFELTSVTPEGDPVFQSVAFKIDGRQYPVYSSTSLVPFMTTGRPSNITRFGGDDVGILEPVGLATIGRHARMDRPEDLEWHAGRRFDFGLRLLGHLSLQHLDDRRESRRLGSSGRS